MTEPTEEEKQAVIAYFKGQGFELYKTEGINKVDAELIEAKGLLVRFANNLNRRHCELIDDIYKLLEK